MLRASDRKRHVVVDMTPLEPDGQNGGAGLVATSLVQHMAAQADSIEFTLLTAQSSHAELARLDTANVRRRCVVTRPRKTSAARRLADMLVPPGARVQMKRAFYSLRTSRRFGRVTDDLQPDVLFCPFSVPYFWRAGVACVCIVYDLQHVRYPEFFSVEQRLNRQRHLAQACARADRLVCISDYVRRTLETQCGVRPEQVLAVPLGLLQEASDPDPRVLDSLGLAHGTFLIYPANFWPHKNHLALFEALRLHRQTQPESSLRLVCTGAPNPLMRRLEDQVPRECIVFAGYVSPGELAALFDASAALIFPSLYEGFGMPVLEAMARGTPVLCSNVTSLPEVAGDAAVYFDPTDPLAMAGAIQALRDKPRVAELVARGRARARAFGTAREMAARYLDVFEQLMPARG